MPAALQLEPPPVSAAPDPPPRRKGTLLIVDDEDGPRQSLQVIFKDDYQIFMAGAGPPGIEFARKNRSDVAVLDIRMGGMSAIEALGRQKYTDTALEAV